MIHTYAYMALSCLFSALLLLTVDCRIYRVSGRRREYRVARLFGWGLAALFAGCVTFLILRS
ncbi:hypothetical protein F4V43_01015 [Paenibacillus spiritus]|uniref:Uncharacterized protein n=1 Tax=Paenibacillus spiritus TaxID=2496557 RepID=A0A5J5GLY2_9BACL|nr:MULTISPECIES: CLC_0170 family protein [Paenibacillus]KAA9008492.1 hypothetical protein F4V43_01015 [Paenibacillus spiritus]